MSNWSTRTFGYTERSIFVTVGLQKKKSFHLKLLHFIPSNADLTDVWQNKKKIFFALQMYIPCGVLNPKRAIISHWEIGPNQYNTLHASQLYTPKWIPVDFFPHTRHEGNSRGSCEQVYFSLFLPLRWTLTGSISDFFTLQKGCFTCSVLRTEYKYMYTGLQYSPWS